MNRARKKAENDIQRNCENEAKQFVVEYFEQRGLLVSKKDIYIAWFAFTQNGYICKLSFNNRPNIIFEFSMNRKTGSKQCDCYERFEYIAIPSNEEPQRFIYKSIKVM